MKIKYEALKPKIGAMVHVTRSDLAEESVAKDVLELLEDRGVLVFPRLGLTDAEQLAFTDKLGGRVMFSSAAQPLGDTGDPDVYKITLDAKVNPNPEYVLGTYFWHMDGLSSDIPPPKATLLSARKLSAKGGQTEFASTFAAYEYLPDDDKAEIADLKAQHHIAASLRYVIDTPSDDVKKRWFSHSVVKEHPLVWKQKSGRKSLVVGTTADHVVGMPIPEGRALLIRLLEWTAQPDFCYRHQWQPDDLVIWNNCGVLHRVIPYDRNSGRMMHRTTIAGTEYVN